MEERGRTDAVDEAEMSEDLTLRVEQRRNVVLSLTSIQGGEEGFPIHGFSLSKTVFLKSCKREQK